MDIEKFLENLDGQLNEDVSTKAQIIAKAAAYKELYAQALTKAMIKYLINTDSEIWDDVMDDAANTIDSIQRKLKLSDDAYDILHDYFEEKLMPKIKSVAINTLKNIDFKII